MGPSGRSWRWAKRKPWLAGLSAVLLLTFAIGTPTLLSLWLRARADRASAMSKAAISKAVYEFLNKDLLAKASAHNQSAPGSGPDPDIKLRDVLDLAAGTIGSRFAAQPLVEASIQQTIGETYQQLGLFQKALPHLERALELHRREQGPGHPDTLVSMAALGSVKLADGKLDEAEALIVPAMDGLVRQRGPDDPDTLPVRRGMEHLPRYQTTRADHLRQSEAMMRFGSFEPGPGTWKHAPTPKAPPAGDGLRRATPQLPGSSSPHLSPACREFSPASPSASRSSEDSPPRSGFVRIEILRYRRPSVPEGGGTLRPCRWASPPSRPPARSW